jgi:hypothetical protein
VSNFDLGSYNKFVEYLEKAIAYDIGMEYKKNFIKIKCTNE